MSFELRLSSTAARFYGRADATLVRRLNRVFERLEKDPFRSLGVTALHGPLHGEFQVRVGDWRVIFVVDTDRQVVTVLLIAHRSSVYE